MKPPIIYWSNCLILFGSSFILIFFTRIARVPPLYLLFQLLPKCKKLRGAEGVYEYVVHENTRDLHILYIRYGGYNAARKITNMK